MTTTTVDNNNSTNNSSLTPIKISSSISPLNKQQIAVGLNSNLNIYDIHSQSIISSNPNAHYSSILNVNYNPLKSFNLTTTGIDKTIKFWDTRKMNSPYYIISNNPHWVWDTCYNNTYSRLLLTCSSSALVRLVIFEEEFGDNIKNSNNNPYSNYNCSSSSSSKIDFIDYVDVDDSAYAIDFSLQDQWMFASISYNNHIHVNMIPDDIKYKILIE